MQPIKGILFEPVGCLAEFPAEPFLEAARFFTGKKQAAKSGSRAYWHLLNLMEGNSEWNDEIKALEMQAVTGASVYEDVAPALAELKAMDVTLCIASSLSGPAVERFLATSGLREFFSTICNRGSAKGVKSAPIRQALHSLKPEQTMYLTDTAEGLKTASSTGVNSILMMNDPDEAKRLAMKNPAGGIVSLHELPDFLRFVQAQPV